MAARLPSRLLSRHVQNQVCCRTFTSSASRLEAHNFTMPAMSPTMTEGNISSWKVKEGDTFSTGDVLLEIETDKASMDVEAQEDGVMAKIFVQDGSKGIKVGTRIAVLGDEGDDVSTLEIPLDDAKPAPEPAKEEAPPKEAAPKPSEEPKPAPSKSKSKSGPAPTGPGQNKKYPLYPSVIALIHENHIDEADVAKIPASGPNGRLLKGDVLGYLGTIAAEYSSQQSKRIEKMGHMDLSNIKIPPPAEKPAAKAAAQALPELPAETSISLPISLTEVLKVQKRVQESLGVSLPLSTFLSRAMDIANDDLPKSKGATPSADELFNAVLGLDSIAGTSRGAYIPQITALPSPVSTWKVTSTIKPIAQPDIIDILSGKATSSTRPVNSLASMGIATGAAPGGATNIFSVTVPVGEEKRARTFLERMKTVLQIEPGKLIL